MWRGRRASLRSSVALFGLRQRRRAKFAARARHAVVAMCCTPLPNLCGLEVRCASSRPSSRLDQTVVLFSDSGSSRPSFRRPRLLRQLPRLHLHLIHISSADADQAPALRRRRRARIAMREIRRPCSLVRAHRLVGVHLLPKHLVAGVTRIDWDHAGSRASSSRLEREIAPAAFLRREAHHRDRACGVEDPRGYTCRGRSRRSSLYRRMQQFHQRAAKSISRWLRAFFPLTCQRLPQRRA